MRDINANMCEYQTLRFTRCVFGVTSSPFHLMATLNHHFAKYAETYPEVVKELGHCMYVDDLTSGADSDMEGFALVRTAKDILAEGRFNLREFATNSKALETMITSYIGAGSNTAAGMTDLTYSEVTTCPFNVPCDEPFEQKVLGVV